MATKGYNSYRGRMSGGKIVLIVVLALVLVGAVAYLALQNYVVYDEAGNATIDLPFFHRKDDRGEKTDDSTVDGTGDRDDIVDTVVPEHPHVKVAALHGTRLPDDCLWWGADYIMNTLAPEDLVLALKRTTGGITYATDVETPPTPGGCRKRRWSGRTGSCGTTRRGRPGWTPPTRRCCNTSPRW